METWKSHENFEGLKVIGILLINSLSKNNKKV